jgi:ATP adenylyltransferase
MNKNADQPGNRPGLDILWAPWRMEYITSNDKTTECILCSYPKSNDDSKYHIFLRGESCFAILNRYPYTNGHIMVVPYRHVADLNDLGDDELLETMKMVGKCEKLLQKTMSPQGFNIGLNLGLPAGAGIADHIHFHIVPRWSGDTNFATTIGLTRVIPQSLDEVYELFRAKLARN